MENGTEYLKEFIRLNEEWICRYFQLEEADYKLRADPFRVIEEGGYIFSIVEDNQVLGVCALFNKEDDIYELARMAVDSQYQDKGIDNKLMQAVMDKLESLEAKRVYLYSNTMLDPAIALYRKYGFKTVSEGQHPDDARCNIVMEKQFL